MRSVTAALGRTGARISASFDGLPIRLRLAGVSALLTFVILCAFALAIGSLTVHRIRTDFNHEVSDTARQLPSELKVTVDPTRGTFAISPPLRFIAPPGEHSVIRVLDLTGNVIAQYPTNAPALGPPVTETRTVNGYRVVSNKVVVLGDGLRIGQLIFEYGRRVSDTEATVKRVELFLFLGVLAGSVFALIAGIAIARRAMAPIAALTSTAAEIARTRDPSRRIPEPQAEDEVAELAHTLESMLRELDAARAETESTLARQRQFVADASHELRTPLTSVLANLELLAESLHGDQGEAASSALRSSQRMRRLVADLLLLARTDAARVVPRGPCDLAQIVVEVAGELGPVSAEHDISLDVHPAIVLAARDELHRLTVNLLENALRHTPAGTEVRVSTATVGGQVELVVEDDGPGVPAELVPTLFERFVRGAGDRGGSFGLGLAIVRAVAESHGGSVVLQPRTDHAGARFVVRLPAYSDLDDDGQHHRPSLETVID
ncbi:MAG TPA: HAMP domain-containing sensor histidine kinase [Solirubrobacteraceae bacterium]|nr:HAMP domain-containing sensor histidine kinase [Solirubrobacteraceae bacterium]